MKVVFGSEVCPGPRCSSLSGNKMSIYTGLCLIVTEIGLLKVIQKGGIPEPRPRYHGSSRRGRSNASAQVIAKFDWLAWYWYKFAPTSIGRKVRVKCTPCKISTLVV